MTANMQVTSQKELILPDSLASRSDLTRLIRELEALVNVLISDRARRRVGFEVENRYTISEQMKDLLEVNNLNLSSQDNRDNLLIQLNALKNQAPIVHVTLASMTENADIAKLVQWFRQNVSPHTILAVGIQPGLIGGVYIRTPNHVYDHSIRSQLEGHHDIITRELEELSGRL